MTTTTLWALIHESIHGHFHSNKRVNTVAGRILCTFYGAPYRILRFWHLAHHGLNRTAVDRSEVYDPATQSRRRAAVIYYPYLLGGLYVLEALSTLFAFVPTPLLRRGIRRHYALLEGDGMYRAALRQLLEPARLREIRVDSLCIISVLALAVYSYGASWPLFAAALFGRALIISVFDNAFHYETSLTERRYAHNLRLPMTVSRLILHANFHGEHHRRPGLPWIMLPRSHASGAARYAGDYVVMALRQLRGPIALPELSANIRERSAEAPGIGRHAGVCSIQALQRI